MNYEVEDQYNVFIKDVGTGLLSHELYLGVSQKIG